MYLKSIEVQGFKSFANKILFEFHNGITGIVGPNGSGKSNVADAVRWVLGEQRAKQLRGSNMQDVIFSGTELRKPQGFAYVAITLDNSDHQLAIDFEEVTVARRVYRSGESEYLINGSTCRLKDVHELFYDTGIGKEGYSIIGQGQIDKILSGKPEERRELFDEAAGIVKFKRRKYIAQKKLEDEKQNLVRVNDILSELEKQVAPLARQSESAKEYLKLKDELKYFDVNLFLMETKEMKHQLKEVERNEEIVLKNLEEVREKEGALKAEYEMVEQELIALEEVILKTREEVNQAKMLRGNLEGQINVLKEQINTEKINADHFLSRKEAIHTQQEEKSIKEQEYETERNSLSDKKQKTNQTMAKMKELLEEKEQVIQTLEERIEFGKTSMIDQLNEKASLTAKQQRYEAMIEQVSVRRTEVCQRLLKFKSDESSQELQIEEETKRLDLMNQEIDSLNQKIEMEEETYTYHQGLFQQLQKQLNEARQAYQGSHTKLESLKNIAERYDGYGNSIKRVMEQKEQIPGIYGVVADLITVPKDYEIAIETALGGSIQNIVTDSEGTAKQLIEHLKRNKYGRATFLPLTSIGNKSTFHQDQALKESGVLGLASRLVQVDEKYEGLVTYLLGRVVVAKTIEDAIALARKYQYSLRIVTLEGELLSAGGSMSGGAFKNTSNLLGRKREIEDLEGICLDTKKRVEHLKVELEKEEKLLAKSVGWMESLKEQRQEGRLRQNTLHLSIKKLEEKKKDIQDSYVDLVRENQQLQEQIQEVSESQSELICKIQLLESKNIQENSDILSLSSQLDQEKKQKGQYADTFSTIQLEVANIQQKDQFLLENLRRIREEKRVMQEEFSGLLIGQEESEQVVQEKEQEIKKLGEMIAHTATTMEKQEGYLQEKVREKQEQASQQKGFFKKREELSLDLSRLDKEVFRLQGQKEKLEERMDGHVNYMWDEYELTFSSAEQLKDEAIVSMAEVKKQIEHLKMKIRSLGNVNVNAIEDYKEVSERYKFMKTQHDDLIEAEGILLKIIEELDRGMRRQFEEKFREIKEEFDKVFKELFGGGKGTLELMDEGDILETGIQIISQPPGKKLQNMMQLSGGEKALTAIALLFAIQNLKPSPFCLLDEIEAALDDSNVDRFAGYLHKLTQNTQFIVITHRRGTMIASDRLYGITMQEKGVSTLVSVNLIEKDLN